MGLTSDCSVGCEAVSSYEPGGLAPGGDTAGHYERRRTRRSVAIPNLISINSAVEIYTSLMLMAMTHRG